jgi:hypothetical protein
VFCRDVEGREKLRVKAGFFQIIEVNARSADLQLAVPKDSVALVVSRIQEKLPGP